MPLKCYYCIIPGFLMLEVDEDDQPNDEGDEHDGGDNHG